MKIAVNKCFGGFSLSQDVYEELGIEWDGYGYLNNDDLGIDSDNYLEFRKHPKLIDAIEKIGEDKASGSLSKVRIIHIPDDVEWEIDEYDGVETVHAVHCSW